MIWCRCLPNLYSIIQECWLQPALLITLLYRFDSAGVDTQASVESDGKWAVFFCAVSVLAQVGGYTVLGVLL